MMNYKLDTKKYNHREYKKKTQLCKKFDTKCLFSKIIDRSLVESMILSPH